MINKLLRDYKKYKVWIMGHQLALDVHRATQKFPQEETYGLISQMSRAACSIPSNIAEGRARESELEFNRYLSISQGSASELEYFNILVGDLGSISENAFSFFYKQIDQEKKSLHSLIKKIKLAFGL